jgi:N-methylhydantoinase B/oxoprolinase/acetone carboxylase alpha subunit
VRDMVERAAADLASGMPWPSNPMVAVGRDDGRPILVSDPSRAPSLAASAAYLFNFFDDLQPGDAIISNDPFVGASHVTDFTLVHRARRSTALARVRLPDIGGFEFGGLAPQSFDTWGEGARFPALRVSVAGRPRHEALNLVALNSRTPALLRMGLAAMERVAAGLSDAFDEWDEDGEDTLFSAASAGRLALAELTAGSYRAEAPVESPVPGEPPVVRVELTIGSQRPRLSFAGSSRQLEAPLNSPPGHTLDCCLCALADAVPSFPLAPGALDSLEIDTGENTITGASAPAITGLAPYFTARAIRRAVGTCVQLAGGPETNPDSWWEAEGRADYETRVDPGTLRLAVGPAAALAELESKASA